MKRLLGGTLILTSLLIALAQKAEAGILMMGAGYAVEKITDDEVGGKGVAIAIAGLGVSLVGSVVGGVTTIFVPSLGHKIMAASVILGIDSNISSEQLKQYINEKYPFLDNQEVTSDLVRELKIKYSSAQNENAFITLDELSVRSILAPASLERSQLELMINDFK